MATPVKSDPTALMRKQKAGVRARAKAKGLNPTTAQVNKTWDRWFGSRAKKVVPGAKLTPPSVGKPPFKGVPKPGVTPPGAPETTPVVKTAGSLKMAVPNGLTKPLAFKGLPKKRTPVVPKFK